MASLRIEMLGRFNVTHNGKPVMTVNTSRLQALLAYLALKGRAGQSREHLSFLFWPDSSESQARTNLRQLLHHLRSGLPDCDSYLEIGASVLRWRTEADVSSDVAEFEQAASTHAGERDEAIPGPVQKRLEGAVQLYQGDLLPGFYDDWVQAERRLLRQRYTSLLVRLAAHMEKSRAYPAAISYAERLLSCAPLSEVNHQMLMRLHALNGDRAGVLGAYQRCVTVLKREMNAEPGISTRKLYEEMARFEPAPTVNPPLTSRSPDDSSPLVGRRKELDRILESWRAAAGGRAKFALILGESGIGKTRLAEEAMGMAGQVAHAAYARCYVSERNLAFAPVTHWLRSETIHRGVATLPESDLIELARVIPELLKDQPGLTPPQPLAESWHRRRFFESLARAILISPQPLLLVMDDLQWCDPESLEWLEFLLHFEPRAKLLVVATARDEEIGGKHDLRPILNRLIGDGLAIEVVLSALDRDETTDLVRRVSRQKLDDRSLDWIYRWTRGNPLFVVEMLRAGLASCEERDNGGEEDSPPTGVDFLPPKVRALLASRLAHLSPPAQDLAGVAATIGRAFTPDLLLKVSGLGETDLAPLIDELWERRILCQPRTGWFDFSHDKLREVAYGQLGPGRRSSLHRVVAQTLEATAAEDVQATSARIASHYERAGMPAQAILHYVDAAKSSRTRYADKQAIQYFTKGLQLLESLPQTRRRDEQELEILILLGPVIAATQGYAADEAGRIYSRARLLCEFLSARQTYFPVLWGSWVFHVVRGNFEIAQEFAARFGNLARECGNTSLVAAGHFMMGCTLFHIGQAAQAREHFTEALARYDPQHYPFVLHEYGPELGVFSQSYLAHVLWILGHPEQSLDQISSALNRARELGNPFSIALALVYSAMLYQFLGEPQEASNLAEQAAALCNEYGFGYYRAWPLIFGGWAMAVSGRAAEGLDKLGKGIEDLRKIHSRLRDPYYLGLLAEACIAAGQHALAMAHVRDAFAVIEKGGETWAESEVHRIKGNLLQHQGDFSGAEASYQRAFSLASRQGSVSFALRAALALGRLWTAQGKQTQARKLLRNMRGAQAWQANAPALKELETLLGLAARVVRKNGDSPQPRD